ncbi:MAG: UvrD-helicase domain-containing protein [Candidatus Riflebacteria bacterium]|nr:UvrD-helicase domain-containing protein [Candidatus Riflebacteria bacterium]
MEKPVSDLNSVLVSASAGSGKTFELSTRYISLVCRGSDPATILATTFTRKAAGEILERVLQRIAEAAKNDEKAEKLWHEIALPEKYKARCENTRLFFLDALKLMRDSLHRLSITTMDGFFSGIAGSFPFELGMTGDVEPTEEDSEISRKIYSLALEELFRKLGSSEAVNRIRKIYRDKLKRSVFEMFLDRIEAAFPIYCAEKNIELWEQTAFSKDEILTDLELKTKLSSAEIFLDNSVVRSDKRFLEAWKKVIRGISDQNWVNFITNGFVKKALVKSSKYYNHEIPEEISDLVIRLYNHAKNCILRQVHAENKCFGEFLSEFEPYFKELKVSKGLIFFSDLPREIASKIAFDTEESFDEIYYRLDGRIQHVFLDEFQDTSISQWKIFQPLAREICATAEPGTMNRSIFLVGDPKQSIYGWRDGCPELFDEVINDPLLYIRQERKKESYRSRQAIIDTVNLIFSNIEANPGINNPIFREVAGDFQRIFDEHSVAIPGKKAGWVELIQSPSPEESESERPSAASGSAAEASNSSTSSDETEDAFSIHQKFCAKKIKQLHRMNPEKTIGVLVRTNKIVKQMIFHLRELGVAASGEGKNPLDDEASVLAILAALKLADNPNDMISAFHLFSSPLGKYLGFKTIPDSTKISSEIRKDIYSKGLQQTLTNWTRFIAPIESERSLDRLLQLIKISGEYDFTKNIRLSDFVNTVRRTRVEQVEAAQVRVMTIHGSKGLGFDIVVLPQLNFDFLKSFRDPVYVMRNNPLEPAQAIFCSVSKDIRDLSPEITEAYSQQLKKRIRDLLCALYVAVTRAKESLYMIVEPLRRKKSGEYLNRGLSDDSYAAILRGALTEDIQNFHFDDDTESSQQDYSDCQKDASDKLFSTGDDPFQQDIPEYEIITDTADFDETVISEGNPLQHTKKVPSITLKMPGKDETPFRTFQEINPSRIEKTLSHDTFSDAELEKFEYGNVVHFIISSVEWLPEKSNHFQFDKLYLEFSGKSIPASAKNTAIKYLKKKFPETDTKRIEAALRSVVLFIYEKNGIDIFKKPSQADFRLFREQSFSVKTTKGLISGTFDRALILYKNDIPFKASIWEFKSGKQITESSIQESYKKQLAYYKESLACLCNIPQKLIESELVFINQLY